MSTLKSCCRYEETIVTDLVLDVPIMGRLLVKDSAYY